jgi:hypothetical protein
MRTPAFIQEVNTRKIPVLFWMFVAFMILRRQPAYVPRSQERNSRSVRLPAVVDETAAAAAGLMVDQQQQQVVVEQQQLLPLSVVDVPTSSDEETTVVALEVDDPAAASSTVLRKAVRHFDDYRAVADDAAALQRKQ